MVILSHLLRFGVHHSALLLGFSMPVFIVLLLVSVGPARRPNRPLPLRLVPFVAPFALILPFVNVFASAALDRAFVSRNGVRGTGIVTEIVPTGGMVNHVRVVEYRTLIRRDEAASLSPTPGSFDNDSDAFYPQPRSLHFPRVGVPFAVLTIPGDEANFLVLTNDVSTRYGRETRCLTLAGLLATAQATASIQPGNVAADAAYQAQLQAFQASECDRTMDAP